MRILYYHQYFKTRKGVGGTRSYEFARKLIEKGHEVTIVCSRNSKEDLLLSDSISRKYRRGTVDGINVIQIDLLLSNNDSLIKRAIKFIAFILYSVKFVFKEKYDVLFASSTPLTIGIPGLIVKFFRPKTKFIFEVRDLWPELPKAMGVIKNPILIWFLDKLEASIYRSADYCIGLSPGMVEGIEKKGISRKKIELIPNASDVDLFIPGIQKRSIIRGVGDNEFVAIYTGTHGEANGLDYVLKVARELKEKGVLNIKFVLIGDGSKKAALIKQAKEHLLDNCIFLDPVPKIELRKIMQAADVGMMILADIPAFAYGTSPNKFFDYISMGMPVVVNHFGWVADMIIENKCGYAVSPKEPKEYAKKLIFLSQNTNICINMGCNSRNLAEQNFDRNLLSEKFVELITK